MKFPTRRFRVCLIFYTYDSADFKSIGNNTMKKMLLLTALAHTYYRMYQHSLERLLFKTNRQQ